MVVLPSLIGLCSLGLAWVCHVGLSRRFELETEASVDALASSIRSCLEETTTWRLTDTWSLPAAHGETFALETRRPIGTEEELLVVARLELTRTPAGARLTVLVRRAPLPIRKYFVSLWWATGAIASCVNLVLAVKHGIPSLLAACLPTAFFFAFVYESFGVDDMEVRDAREELRKVTTAMCLESMGPGNGGPYR